MKVTKKFVEIFLTTYILIIIILFLSFLLKSYNYFLGGIIVLMTLILILLILRKTTLFENIKTKVLTSVLEKKVLIFSYTIILLLIILFHTHVLRVLSYENIFISFLLVAFLFFIYRIDSRYLILPAILLLWLAPFLLIYKLQALAEGMAIYAYYFLVVGVILQLIEFKRKKKTSLKFEIISNFLFEKKVFLTGVFFLILFGVVQILKLGAIYKAFSLYFGVTLIIIYLLKYLLKND